MVITEALQTTFPPEAVDALVGTMRRTVPVGRILTVEEVGELVVYLASEQGALVQRPPPSTTRAARAWRSWMR